MFFQQGRLTCLLICLLLATKLSAENSSARFTLAVIPDTQNYLDYSHQKNEGFALNASDLFIEQMKYIADNSVAKGGDIAFVAAVGDVWQHQSKVMDKEHLERGFKRVENPFFAAEIQFTDKTRSVELPKAVEGYRLLAKAGVPFGVAPGNHDYDAMWSVDAFPPNVAKNPRQLTMTPEDLGMLHIGGLDNFRSVFGSDSAFFKNKPWYVDSFKGGANSAQVFEAAGYRFLHITMEMQAGNDVLSWVESVLAKYPGLPTILTMHDFLSTSGERKANPIVDLARVDPAYHNSAEQLWEKLIAPNEQIFLVLCGHQHGQALKVDQNAAGFPVYQVLADYQSRGQVGLDAGQPLNPHRRMPAGIGDGWFRLMEFDLGKMPQIKVKTYSSHYKKTAQQLPTYAQWYKSFEQPQMTDQQFINADDYRLDLKGFHERFSKVAILP